MKKILVIIILLAAGFAVSNKSGLSTLLHNPAVGSTSENASADTALASAFEAHQSNVEVQGGGIVTHILADDNDGGRHQRFIVQLESGQTLLIAHNIDLAPRIHELAVGERVEFKGEYDWNDKGGVIHWTHRDPQGRHTPGWLKHNGQTYN